MLSTQHGQRQSHDQSDRARARQAQIRGGHRTPNLACNLEGNEMLRDRFRRERGEANTSQVCALRLFWGLFGRWTKLRGATVAVGGGS